MTSSTYGPDAALFVDWTGSVKEAPAEALYFFRGSQYIRWSIEDEKLFPGYPRAIKDGWPGLLDVFPGKALSGAFHVPEWGNRIFFMFRGESRMVLWDVANHRLDPRTEAADAVLPSRLTEGGQFAPLCVQDDAGRRVYAFRGDEYTRWTVKAGARVEGEDDGYPRKIGDGWTGGLLFAPVCAVSVHWPTRSKALNNNKVYFFLGDLYGRWDVKSHSLNYRLGIPEGWKGWPQFG